MMSGDEVRHSLDDGARVGRLDVGRCDVTGKGDGAGHADAGESQDGSGENVVEVHVEEIGVWRWKFEVRGDCRSESGDGVVSVKL